MNGYSPPVKTGMRVISCVSMTRNSDSSVKKAQDKRSLNCEKYHVCKGVGIYSFRI